MRTFQGVDTGPAELWAELLKQQRQSQNFRLGGRRESVELRLEFLNKGNNPRHSIIMTLKSYESENILRLRSRVTE